MPVYAIGDIHGCNKALKTLLKALPLKPDDHFVFLGDYVDKGPNTRKVIKRLLKFAQQYNSTFVKGNHEIQMLAARNNQENMHEWIRFGGAQTLKSYKIDSEQNWHEQIPDEHWDFIQQCVPYYETEKYLFVHAGFEPGVPLEAQNKTSLFWKKYENPKAYSTDKTVICGHTSQKNGEIASFGHTINIDTFAWGGQWLTALEVESGTYYQANQKGEVKARKLV